MSPLNSKHQQWHYLPKDRDFTSHLPGSSRICMKSWHTPHVFFLLTFCGSLCILAHGCIIHGGAWQRLDAHVELWFLEKLHLHVAVVLLHSHHQASVLHLRCCAEDFLLVCSPTHLSRGPQPDLNLCLEHGWQGLTHRPPSSSSTEPGCPVGCLSHEPMPKVSHSRGKK